MTRPAILYEDEAILALDKPSGWIVHRGLAADPETLSDFARACCGAAHPAHRLDRGTSGIVLFAKIPDVARLLGERFAEGRVEKRYLAVVRGKAPNEGVIDYPVPGKEDGPRVAALTRFVTVAHAATEPRATSVVEARPETGRFHQIRRHLKHIDHPLLGDTTYGKAALNRAFRERYGLERLALHASHLLIAHPLSEAPLSLRAPLPTDLEEPLARMGFDLAKVRP